MNMNEVFMRRTLFIFYIILISFSMINHSRAAEMTSFDFLRTHIGARPSALAGAFTAISGDIHAMFFNPAGLADIDQRVASTTYLNHVLDIQSGFVGYAQPLKGIGTVAGGIHFIDYGSFDKTDQNGEKYGSFGANSFVLTGSLGRLILPGLLSGINLKYIRSSIDQYSAQAFALDLGLLYQAPFSENLNIGLAVLNLGQSTSAFIKTREDLPLKIAAGFSKKLAHLPLLFNLNLYKFIDDDFQFSAGGEFTLSENLFLRLGYNSIGRDQRVKSDYDAISGFSLGLGFRRNHYHLDYGFSSLGQVGSLNRITFSADF